jgi:hypothetical protein
MNVAGTVEAPRRPGPSMRCGRGGEEAAGGVCLCCRVFLYVLPAGWPVPA